MQGYTRRLIHPGITLREFDAQQQARAESAEAQPELPLPGNPPAGQASHLARAIDVGRIAIASRIRHGERLSSLRGEIANLTLAEDVLLGVEELPSGTD